MNISNKKVERDNVYTEVTPAIYRTAKMIKLSANFVSKKATAIVQVNHYKDDSRTENESLPVQEVALGITNEQLVDKTTGEYASENTTEENKQGEFDFFYTQNIASIESMIQMAIQRADTLNQFD